MSSKPILYSYFRSSCTWRVRIALAYKGIEYETRPVNLIKDGGEQFSDEYKKINPMAQVPALFINGQTLIQSSSILEYLEEIKPNPKLLPGDALQRAKIRAICECIGSGIQPLQNLGILRKVDENLRKELPPYFISEGFKAVETLLRETAGKYSVGDVVTLADCYLVPQVYNAVRFNADMTPFPIIRKVVAELEKLEAFQVSHPSKQIDFPENLPK